MQAPRALISGQTTRGFTCSHSWLRQYSRTELVDIAHGAKPLPQLRRLMTSGYSTKFGRVVLGAVAALTFLLRDSHLFETLKTNAHLDD